MKKTLLVLPLIFAHFSASALSLTESMVYSYNNNPELAAKREEVKAIDEKMFEAISGFLPSIYFSSNVVKNSLSPNSIRPKRENSRTRQDRLVLNQDIFNGGSTLAAIESAKYIIEQSRAKLSLTESQIFLHAVSSYSDVLFRKEALEANKKNVADLQNHLNATKEKYNAGIVTRTQVAMSEQSLAISQSNKIRAEGDYANAIANFQKEIGVEPNELLDIVEKVNSPSNLQEAIDIALKENFEIIAAKNDFKAADLQIKSVVATMWPDLSLQAEIGGQSSKNYATRTPLTEEQFGKRSDYKAVSLTLRVPIFQQGREYSNIRKAKASSASSKSRLALTINSVKESVTKAWTGLENSKANLIASKKAHLASKVALDGAMQEYNEGLMSLTDLLETKSKYFNSNIQKLSAEKTVIDAAYYLQAVIGKLTAKNMELPTKYYDVTENYNNSKFKLIGF